MLKFLVAFVMISIVAVCIAAREKMKDVIHAPTSQPCVGTVDKPAGPLDFVVKDIDGKDVKLSDYRGKVVMIVNVASKCGFTPQYKGLESLYKKYADQGFIILGFPANNFGHQEPGTNDQIKEFCTSKFDVTFPMMAKISVKGDDQAPLYKFLTDAGSAGDFKGDISWNFNKFVVDRNGNVIARFDSATTPEDPNLVELVEKALAAKVIKLD